MKVEWEESDIKCGMQWYSGNSEIWIIGYIVHEKQDTLYTLISLADGMVQTPTGKAELAVRLNKGGYIPVVLANVLKGK